MAHIEKYGKAAVGHLAAHYERAKGEDGQYVNFGNQDIDPARTPSNYNLGPARKISQGEFVRRRCESVRCLKRKDVKVMCDWVVTAPKEISPSEHEKFFQETYVFLEKRYGKGNVVSAYVHMDEVTPHMHFAFVPVAYDKKKQQDKVSAKDVITRKELQVFHNDLDSHMSKVFGRDIGILNNATKDGNMSVGELKRKSAAERLAEANKKASQIVKEAERKVELLEYQVKGLKGQLAAYKGALTSSYHIDGIGSRTITGKISMSVEDASALKEQAKAYFSATADKTYADSELMILKNHYKKLEDDAPRLKNKIKALTQERDGLLKDCQNIKKVIHSNPDLLEAFNAQEHLLQMEEQRKREEFRKKRGIARKRGVSMEL